LYVVCYCVTFAESEPYCHSGMFVWSPGIYLSSDPCKPFWIPCLPYSRCQMEKYGKFRLFSTRNACHLSRCVCRCVHRHTCAQILANSITNCTTSRVWRDPLSTRLDLAAVGRSEAVFKPLRTRRIVPLTWLYSCCAVCISECHINSCFVLHWLYCRIAWQNLACSPSVMTRRALRTRAFDLRKMFSTDSHGGVDDHTRAFVLTATRGRCCGNQFLGATRQTLVFLTTTLLEHYHSIVC